MTENSFQTTIEIEASPGAVFGGVRDVRGWWSEDLEGSSSEVGDEFTYRDEGIRYARIRLTRVEPDSLVEWEVLDSYLNFVEDHEEWTGTRMTFELTPLGDATRLQLTHHGLLPVAACYGACSSGWGRCMVSLKKLVTRGRGTPNLPDDVPDQSNQENEV